MPSQQETRVAFRVTRDLDGLDVVLCAPEFLPTRSIAEEARDSYRFGAWPAARLQQRQETYEGDELTQWTPWVDVEAGEVGR